jgi:cytochrome d ubiquinol oxidase subunit II
VNNTASPSYTLKVMTLAAVIGMPVVIFYQAWSYRVFRRRLSVPRVGGDDTTATDATATDATAPDAVSPREA